MSPPTELTAPLEHLLTTGSDTRLTVDPLTQLNSYGCTPTPRPAIISFASTTATSISAQAFQAAEQARAQLLQASLHGNAWQAFDDTVALLGAKLKRAFDVDDPGVEIVLSPSGTDSQLQALFITRAVLGAPLTSVIVAADETGSGTAYTSLGLHFNTVTAHGVAVAKATNIAGLANEVSRVEVAARDGRGAIRSLDDIDADVISASAAARAAGRKVLLQVMDQSKSGLGGPSPACLQLIKERWGETIQVVVDACQGRIGTSRLRQHLADGHIVLVTGSKFFVGPPFSGAMFVPANLSDRLCHVRDVPAGLLDYSGRSEWPRRWANIRAQLGPNMNFGLWLRWEAALSEIEAYRSVPNSFRMSALTRFARVAPSLIAESPVCKLVEPASANGSIHLALHTDSIRTIFPFFVIHNGRCLSYKSARAIHASLNRDLSGTLAQSTNGSDRHIAATSCHIGQPFPLKDPYGREVGALRISADARLVSESWDGGDETASLRRIDHKIDQVRTVLEKIRIALSLHNVLEDAA